MSGGHGPLGDTIAVDGMEEGLVHEQDHERLPAHVTHVTHANLAKPAAAAAAVTNAAAAAAVTNAAPVTNAADTQWQTPARRVVVQGPHWPGPPYAVSGGPKPPKPEPRRRGKLLRYRSPEA